MTALERAGYILNMPRRELVGHHELLQRWTDAYLTSYLPRQSVKAYRTDTAPSAPHLADLATRHGAAPGGETAAQVAGYEIRSTTALLYTADDARGMIKELRLRPDPDGDIVLRRRFWGVDLDSSGLAPTLLIHADLLASGDPRQVDIAKRMLTHDPVLRSLNNG